ncbi:MAG: ribulose-phosphate 3-epimerase [Deltaproteobacteria bacterium]|nr:ribulose-phosphate 3-epimerase [Deltaproteobacteria bacterium]
MIQIAPSILACDFARLGEEVRAVEAAGADVIHVDVMDGHFVPNISIGLPVVQSLRPITQLPLDCHLMISDPGRYLAAFAQAGANWISVHAEACDLGTTLSAIRQLGCRAGAVINPETPIDALLPHLATADYLLVMSVNPGFAGQVFLPHCLDKVRQLRAHLQQQSRAIPIQIDGGITLANVSDAVTAGAEIIVAGNTIFKSADYRTTIQQLRIV